MIKDADMVGKVSGGLTVIKRADKHKWFHSEVCWECQCVCGNIVITSGSNIRRGYKIKCSYSCKVLGNEVGEAAFNMIFGQMKKSARVREYSWEIDKESVREITKKPCHYCGDLPSRSADPYQRLNGDYLYNGLDRVNNGLGYTITNVVPCCWKCNKAKSTMSSEEFRELVVSIYKNWASH